MSTDGPRRDDEQFSLLVSRALVNDEWAGAQVLFLLQEEGDATLDFIEQKFIKEKLNPQNANLGLNNLLEVGIAKREDNRFSLTIDGTKLVEQLLEKLSSDPQK